MAFVNVLRISPTSTAIKQQLTFGTSKSLPRFLIWPEDRSIAEGDEVIFECLALNDASLFSELSANVSLSSLQFFKYKWLKDGVALDIEFEYKKELFLKKNVSFNVYFIKNKI